MYLLQHYKLLWMNSHYHQIFVIFIKVAVFWLRNWPVKRPQWLGSNEKRICKTITVGLSNMWTRKKLSVNYYPVNTRFWRLTYFRRFCFDWFYFLWYFSYLMMVWTVFAKGPFLAWRATLLLSHATYSWHPWA